MRFEQTAQWEQALKPELVERRLTRNGVARHYVVYSPRSEQTYPVLLEVTTTHHYR